MLIQYLNETRHVSAFEVMGQFNIHIKVRNSMLLTFTSVFNPHRMANVFNPYLINSDLPVIVAALDICYFTTVIAVTNSRIIGHVGYPEVGKRKGVRF